MTVKTRYPTIPIHMGMFSLRNNSVCLMFPFGYPCCSAATAAMLYEEKEEGKHIGYHCPLSLSTKGYMTPYESTAPRSKDTLTR
ncbi:hypothetical protein Ahy_A09g043881 isoform C [Arachis hypogaea]|uniref:Uncharacterized protein n=1 Tax=Arachis hypogaea TaxID=3818 RepID=A0A445BJ71_ARAHY|nr:hypothetical protein Ahy_A09g043881 isoform C [Arachis hypogaea]